MNNFLRAFRKRLIDTGKLKKYMIYALGEIFLIVIGILIALQIDTWNEARKNRIAEEYSLLEMQRDLKEDSLQIAQGLAVLKRSIEGIQGIRAHYDSTAFNPDSLAYHLGKLFVFHRYYPVQNAYETLKASGLSFSDASLKSEVVRYYEHDQNEVLHENEDVETRFMNDYLPIIKNYIQDFKYGLIAVPEDPNDPDLARELERELRLAEDNNRNAINSLESLRSKNNRLTALIQQELSN